jgi:hypothetical protein
MCQVQILAVNGIVPTGSINPTQLRVTGRLTQCPSGKVVVSSNVTSPSTPTSPNYGVNGDEFIVLLPITAPNVTCGDINNPVNVTAECYNSPACNDIMIGPLKCCEVVILWFDSIVVPGSLTPSQIRVAGTLQGCTSDPAFIINDPVIVQIDVGPGVSMQSGPTPVDKVTGSFIALVPITTPIQCDEKVMVNAWCYTDSNCKASTLSDRLKCPQCARAQVSYISGSCTGTPPLQQITLNTTINIASGTISCFRWIYGDGQSGPMFTINNTAGTANTPYVHSEQHDYSPGCKWP